MSRSDDGVIKLAGVLGIVGFGLIAKGISDFRKKRRVADTASSKTATAAQGLAEFEGFAWHSGTVMKNLAQRDCVLRFIKLQEHVKRNKSSSWETVWSTNNSHFYLVDHTGVVHIHVPDEKFTGTLTTKSWSNVPEPYKNEILGLMQGHSLTSGGFFSPRFPPKGWFGGSFRIVETSIELGSPVYCQGNYTTPTGMVKTVSINGIGSFFEMIQKQARKPVHTMTSLDTNKDGEVCEAEAHAAFTVAGQMAVQKSAKQESPLSAPMHGIVMSSKEHAMILASKHQHYLLKTMGKWCLLEIVGGAAMVAAAAFLLIAKFSSGNSY